MTYDAGVAGNISGSLGFYQQAVTGGMTAKIGGFVFSSNHYTFIVENDRPKSGLDGFNADSNSAFNPSNDLFQGNTPVPGDMSIFAIDLTGSTLSSTSLLALDPSSFNNITLQLLKDDDNFLHAIGTLILDKDGDGAVTN